MKKGKRVLLWIISVLLILMALTYMKEAVFASILLLIVGTILLPPANDMIKEKIQDEKKIKDYRSIRNILAVIISLVFFSSVGSSENNIQNHSLPDYAAITNSIQQQQNLIEQQIKATDTVTTENENQVQTDINETVEQRLTEEAENQTRKNTNQDTTKKATQETKTEEIKETNGKYTGKRVNGKKQGSGTYKWNDGSIYKGKFKDDKIHGKGVLTIPKKGKYSGNFSKGKKNGYGTYTFSNGDVYTGNWKNDKMSGYGTYKFKNGEKYVGNFSNNKFNGKGTYTKNGKKYSGTWEDNQYIK